MLLPIPVLDFVNIVADLTKGAEIHKCKIDGKIVPVTSGTMKVVSSLSVVDINCDCTNSGGALKIEAHHPKSDTNNVIKINGVAMASADIDMKLIPHPIYADIKATLEYQQAGTSHMIELYAKIGY